MMPLLRIFLIFLFLLGSVSAHSSAVNIEVIVEGSTLTALLSDPSGFAIKKAKLEYILFNESGATFRGVLNEKSDGEYNIQKPKAQAGAYTLVIRDTTFPKESLEAKTTVKLPLTMPVSLTLPASTASSPGTGLLILVTVTPVALSVLVLVFVLFRRPKIQTLEPPTQP
jgi:hypothetical protein